MPTTSKHRAQRPATIQDIAAAVGVTKMTVSNVLNGKPNASPATREAVLKAAEELGFAPNPHAQRLSRGGCEQTISLFTLNLDFGVATHKIQHIQKLLLERGFEVPLHAYGTMGSAPGNQAELVAAVRRQRPRAIVCNTGALRPEAVDELRRYQAEGGIVVAYDYAVGLDCDSVVFDREENTYRAAQHLLELGHEKIGLFLHGDSPRLLQPRFHGFERALKEKGIGWRREWIFREGLYAEGAALLAQKFLAMAERPTALCIVNDLVASTFVNEVQRAGLRVPDDVSVVSHDDTPIARYCAVPLTAVSQPVEVISEHVVELLCSRLDGQYQGAARSIVVRGDLAVRESSAAPAMGIPATQALVQ